jgi:hypothetical protein
MLVRWSAPPVYPAEKRLTSMCMEIAGFDHADCPAPTWCSCLCHQPPIDETA